MTQPLCDTTLVRGAWVGAICCGNNANQAVQSTAVAPILYPRAMYTIDELILNKNGAQKYQLCTQA